MVRGLVLPACLDPPKHANNSCTVIAEIARPPKYGYRYVFSLASRIDTVSATSFALWRLSHSPPMASNVSACAVRSACR